MEEDQWTCFRVRGLFAINAPVGSILKQEEGQLFQLSYPDEFGTAMFIGRYFDKRLPINSFNYLGEFVVEKVKCFSEHAFRVNGLKHIVPIDVEVENLSDGVLARGYVMDSKNSSWVIRCYGGLNRKDYWLFHWNGPQSVMYRFVFKSIESWSVYTG